MSEPYLRRANEGDVDLLFRWANDNTVRENAFNTQSIAYDDHVKWFAHKLTSDDSAIYIYCQEDMPLGQARVDVDGDCGMISYSIDGRYRLQGHGGRLLALLEAAVLSDTPHVKLLTGQVKKTNIASQNKFEQLKYERTEKEGYFEYAKVLQTLSAPYGIANNPNGGGNPPNK